MRPAPGTATDAPTGESDWLEYIDHTADAGIVVRAPTARRLFERAAWGMMSVVTDPALVGDVATSRVAIEAEDWGQLMVRWLSEVLFLNETRQMLFGHFDIDRIEESVLRARIGGESFDEDRHEIRAEIKAVTFHQLRVEPDGDGWVARVIFDL